MPDTIHYTCYVALGRRSPAPENVAAAAESFAEDLSRQGVTLRGMYDVAAMPASADLLVWLVGSSPEALQDAVRTLARDVLAGSAELVWTAFGVHREAEFSKEHAPAFMAGAAPKRWLTVYPFVRSYEWYLLPEAERRDMLAEHGLMGRDYPQVQANTVAAFALGDYEWLLALEADELVDLTDLMRHLRSAEARRHVRVETPFFTGHRVEPADLPRVLR
ncbi:MAG TPA: hydrogen peroxide-dependent heme synthase [Propionibacteriaceae bacterium]|nr:hydrogen peroxide-dependent heme synthase [Propionibacteriaceae bacterium]